MADKVASLTNLTVRFLDDQQLASLAALAQRSMALQATLQEELSGCLTIRIIWNCRSVAGKLPKVKDDLTACQHNTAGE